MDYVDLIAWAICALYLQYLSDRLHLSWYCKNKKIYMCDQLSQYQDKDENI